MALSGPKKASVRAERAARIASPERVHENLHIQADLKESSTDIDRPTHSVGCPKFKALSKSKCHLRSPNRTSNNILHPKPWGARDPKEIPCTCYTMRKNLKSAPASVRTSPTREIRKTVPRRAYSPKSPFSKKATDDDEEVVRMFDEFCDNAERTGVKLRPSKLDIMYNKMKSKLSISPPATDPVATAKTRTQIRMGKRRTSSVDSTLRPGNEDKLIVLDKKTPPEAPLTQRSQSNQSNQPSISSQRTSSSTVRGKLETNNVILELSGPDEATALTNIFGSILPQHDRFNYVAMDGSRFFVPSDVLPSGLPATILTIDSGEDYIPDSVEQHARLARSPTRRRRP